ncbi:MAG: type VI secretion system accessory protein TagJ, partial [Pseudomonadota bacterium]
TGECQRALTQLNVVGDLDGKALPMVQTYREAIACEVYREAVFAGKHTPLIFGDPERWVASILQALALSADGNHAQAQELREEAFEDAPAVSGSIDGESFEWLADADSRLGPMLEAIVNGKYYWVPMNRIARITVEEPADLRDSVWTPVYFTWANGGDAPGLVPTRYPGSAGSSDDRIRLARLTEWEEKAEGVYHGLGQRILATDAGDTPLMDARQIQWDHPEVETPDADSDAGAADG